jgi:P-aminobenzoate N-oxygenase AurF
MRRGCVRLTRNQPERRTAVPEITAIVRNDATDLWYEKATVRYAPRILVPDYSSEQLIYPPARVPMCDHPLLLRRGLEVRAYILTQAAYLFLHNVGLMETKFVIQACLDILHEGIDGIGDDDKLQMLAVAIDESFHAHVAHDYILQTKQKSGISPLVIPKSNRKIAAIHRMEASLPEGLRGDFKLLATTIAENVITAEAAHFGRDRELLKSFSTLMMDHVRDESRHAVYFANLMKSHWQTLSAAKQERLGLQLPDFLDDYLAADRTREFDRRLLEGCGLPPEEVAQVIADSDSAVVAEHTLATRNTQARLVRLFKQIGVLDLDTCRRVFAERGYVM